MASEGTAAIGSGQLRCVRELAEKSRDPDARLGQLKMAEQFERLARRGEAQEQKNRDAED